MKHFGEWKEKITLIKSHRNVAYVAGILEARFINQTL